MLGLLAACRGEPGGEPGVSDWPAAELREGGQVAAPLGPGEVFSWRLPLAAGDLLRLTVEQQGADAAVTLFGPQGEPLLAVDRPTENRGSELVLAVAAATGTHRLAILGLENLGRDDGGGGSIVARIETLRPATAAERQQAELYRRFVAAVGAPGSLPAPELQPILEEARQAWHTGGEPELAAEALYRLAGSRAAELDFVAAAALFEAARESFVQASAGAFAASCRVSRANNLVNLNRNEEAFAELSLALPEVRREKLVSNEARVLLSLSQVQQRLGELQSALDFGEEALRLWRPNNRIQRPATLHSLGVLYARRFHDLERGRRLLEEADAAYEPDSSNRVPTLSQLGRLAFEQGRMEEARRHFAAALELRKGKTYVCPSVVLLARLALADWRQNLPAEAEVHLAAGRKLLESAACPGSEPTFEGLAGELAQQRGDAARAKASFERAAGLYRALGDRLGVAESLAGLARAERSLGQPKAALTAARGAIGLLEAARPAVLREDLRTSFFSAGRRSFELAVALLLEAGRPVEAWALAEQARARALRDLLEASPAESPGGDAPARQERRLIRRLNDLESRRLAARDQIASLQRLGGEIAEVVAQLERLRGERRRGDPRYAQLTAAPAPSLAEVRRELLDAQTTVLEYHLGEEGSALWTIRRDALEVHRLPPRRAIETLAGRALASLRSLDFDGSDEPSAALCELAGILLSPVAGRLGPRLIVVPDGALAAFPWAALPEPGDRECRSAPALIEGHAIVYLPSLETLLTQRRQLRRRPPAPGIAAIFADPAYGPLWSRLPQSAAEATAIAALLPADRVSLATGLAANRESALDPRLAGYRILHFATHGRLDPDQPLLSALVLSQVDAAGREIEGLVRAQEIYRLDLAAELVVLSACETGLGREVPGEGMISGLPRAFLAAGARRVLVSLWAVGDRDSRELMTAFYRGLSERKLPAPRALQEAQRELRQAGRPPRSWAGFVLLGDFTIFDLSP